MYIILRGPSGIGKSTIAKELANSINARIYHYDRLMTGLGYKAYNKQLPKEVYLEANKKMLSKYLEILKHKILILDGTFYHKEVIEDLVNKLPNNGFVFTLKASLDTCLKRSLTKEHHLKEDTIKEIYELNFDHGILIDAEQGMNKIIKEILETINQ